MSLTYSTKYSDKRKTLGLIVERDKSVVVLAPTGTSQETVDVFVNKRSFGSSKKSIIPPSSASPNQRLHLSLEKLYPTWAKIIN